MIIERIYDMIDEGIDFTREAQKDPGGFFSKKFFYAFRAIFHPITRVLFLLHITPNMVTIFSLILGIATGVLFAFEYLKTGIIVGLAMGFSDIVDGQLAKAANNVTPFGGILDSFIDRYVDFCVFCGFGAMYYRLGLPWGVAASAMAFLGSVMISYIRARAEAGGYDCKVGKLQRPERLALIGVALLFGRIGIDVAVGFLAIATHFTAVQRLLHVRGQIVGKATGE